jgi:hypothetical protein
VSAKQSPITFGTDAPKLCHQRPAHRYFVKVVFCSPQLSRVSKRDLSSFVLQSAHFAV